MRFAKNLLVLLGLAAATPIPPAPAAPSANNIIAGKYIVVLKESLPQPAVEAHTSWVTDLHRRNIEARAEAHGPAPAGIEARYGIAKFKGYAGSFDDATIAAIKASDDVSADFLFEMSILLTCIFIRSSRLRTTKFGISVP